MQTSGTDIAAIFYGCTFRPELRTGGVSVEWGFQLDLEPFSITVQKMTLSLNQSDSYNNRLLSLVLGVIRLNNNNYQV
ncbi:MAG: hypothetical protein ACI8P9_002351 [Parasphingorhabdus sp.]|jgi:hypothetical protein